MPPQLIASTQLLNILIIKTSIQLFEILNYKIIENTFPPAAIDEIIRGKTIIR